MSTGGEKEPIRITLDDLAQVEVGKPATAEAPATLAAGPRFYGSLSDEIGRAHV